MRNALYAFMAVLDRGYAYAFLVFCPQMAKFCSCIGTKERIYTL